MTRNPYAWLLDFVEVGVDPEPRLYELLHLDLELQRHYGDLFDQLDAHLRAEDQR